MNLYMSIIEENVLISIAKEGYSVLKGIHNSESDNFVWTKSLIYRRNG